MTLYCATSHLNSKKNSYKCDFVFTCMHENLVKNECYICMESCEYTSPCTCATHVHPDCLIAYLNTSGHTHCTICLSQFPIPQPPKQCSAKGIVYVLVAGLFFLFGWLGSQVFQVTYEPFSQSSFVAAILGAIVVFLMYKLWKSSACHTQ